MAHRVPQSSKQQRLSVSFPEAPRRFGLGSPMEKLNLFALKRTQTSYP